MATLSTKYSASFFLEELNFSINFKETKAASHMRNILLLLVVISWGFTSCSKKGPGFYSVGQATPPPGGSGNDSITRYYYFNNVVLDTITNDTFNLPRLTQDIIDSGKVTITFRSSIVWLNTWFPLPVYTFPDGSTVTVIRVSLQPGKAVLKASIATTPPMNYCFALSIH